VLRWIVLLGLSASLGVAASILAFPRVSGAQNSGGGDVFASSTCGWPGHPVDMQRLYAAVGNYPHGQLVFVNRAEKQQLIANLRNQPRTMGQPMWELAPCYGCTQDRDACIIYWVRYWGPTAGDLYGGNDEGPKVPPRVPPTGGDVFSSDCRKNPQSYTCLYGRRGGLPVPTGPGRPRPDIIKPSPLRCWINEVGSEFGSFVYYYPGELLARFTPEAREAIDISRSERRVDRKLAMFAPGVQTAEACYDNGCFPSAVAQDLRWLDGNPWRARTSKNPLIWGPVAPKQHDELLRSLYGTDQYLSIPNFNQNKLRQFEEDARQSLLISGKFSRGLLYWSTRHTKHAHIINWRLIPRRDHIALIQRIQIHGNIGYCPDLKVIAESSRIEFWDASVGEPVASFEFDGMENVRVFETFGLGKDLQDRMRSGH
jgi:hypothetical protein